MANVFALQMQDAYGEAPGFEDFWLVYVRKVAKKDALKEWTKLSAEKQTLAIIGAAEWRPVWLARGEMQYVPHPSTFLHGERWDDELPQEFRAAAHVPVKPREDNSKYVPIPDHVRALLAKLKGKQ